MPAVCRLLLSPVGCGKACRSVARRTRPFKPACGNLAGPCEQRSIVTASPRRPGPPQKNGDAWALASDPAAVGLLLLCVAAAGLPKQLSGSVADYSDLALFAEAEA